MSLATLVMSLDRVLTLLRSVVFRYSSQLSNNVCLTDGWTQRLYGPMLMCWMQVKVNKVPSPTDRQNIYPRFVTSIQPLNDPHTIHGSVYRAVWILISTFRLSDDLWHYRKQAWWFRKYIPIVICRIRSPMTPMQISTSPVIHWRFDALILSILVTTSNMIRICYIYWSNLFRLGLNEL